MHTPQWARGVRTNKFNHHKVGPDGVVASLEGTAIRQDSTFSSLAMLTQDPL